jgi:hypothetical protein
VGDPYEIDELFALRDHAHEESGSLWCIRPDIGNKAAARAALVDLAMQWEKTITCSAVGVDIQFRRRNGKVSFFRRNWGRRNWQPVCAEYAIG